MTYSTDIAYVLSQDAQDTLNRFRKRFYIPTHNGRDAVYLCGNSLGLQPKQARAYIEQEMKDWETLGVEGHFNGKNPWFYYHHFTRKSLAAIVGAGEKEVVAMNTLTNNLHLLMVSFYRPTAKRYKIIMEGGAFPSDQYAMESQVRFHGHNPDDAIIELLPREGEYTLRTEDIIATIHQHGHSVATVMLGGVNYFTGQYFDLETITKAAHEAGATCGFDLAHTVGNIPLKLHDWNVDFACWCTYKYLNSGPGGVGGIFVHDRHSGNNDLPRFAGWWGNPEDTRFRMEKGFIPQEGAAAWQLSNAQVFPMALLKASLDIYNEAGIENMRKKSIALTGYLEFLIDKLNTEHKNLKLHIITPRDPQQRGCQLSIIAEHNGKELFKALADNGVMADWREPNVMRMSPVPLYNTYEDCFRVYQTLQKIVQP